MRILIVGAGMYVTGRNNTGTGTILSSIAQFSKTSRIEEVVVIARSDSNAEVVKTEMDRINRTISSDLKVRYESVSGVEDLDNFLKAEKTFDSAIVSIPDHLHYEFANELLRNKIITLVVKPLTPTLEEAINLRKTQLESHTYAAVEFHKRWDETNLITRKFIADGKIGQVLYYEVGYSQRISIPMETFKGWAHKTNIFQYLGVHYVDLFYFLTGYKPLRCSALGTDGILKQNGVDSWDSVHVMMEWENPANGEKIVTNFNTNWIDPNSSSAMSDQRYKVVGTSGRLEIDQKNRGVEWVSDDSGIQQMNPYFSEYLEDQNGEFQFQGYGYKSIAQFLSDVESIQSGEESMQSLDAKRPGILASLVSTAAIDCVNQSLDQSGQWVEIKLPQELEWK